jgi:heterogeneous nuclear ribonucleoprotein A1/A3
VEIKKAEPKKSSNPPQSGSSRNSRPAYGSDPPRDYPSADSYRGLPSVHYNYSSGGIDPYRSDGGFGGRLGMYGRMGGYGRYYAGLEGYGDRPSFGYPGRFGLYGGGFDGPYCRGGLSGYMAGGADESFGGPGTFGFGNTVYGRPYDSALGDFGPSSTPDRSREGFTGGSGRYHPYGR